MFDSNACPMWFWRTIVPISLDAQTRDDNIHSLLKGLQQGYLLLIPCILREGEKFVIRKGYDMMTYERYKDCWWEWCIRALQHSILLKFCQWMMSEVYFACNLPTHYNKQTKKFRLQVFLWYLSKLDLISSSMFVLEDVKEEMRSTWQRWYTKFATTTNNVYRVLQFDVWG